MLNTPRSRVSTATVDPLPDSLLDTLLDVPTLRTGLTSWWRGLNDAQRRLVWFGLFTFATGLFHVGVWLAAGMPSLAGPVTWRKPIVFGLSIAVAAWSLAWTIRFLPQGRGLTGLTFTSRAVVWLTMMELALIDMQQWRGVASHFNVGTPFDAAVFAAMGIIILMVAIVIALWTWQLVWRGEPDARPERLLAARAGMLFLTLGNVAGIFLASWGSAVQRQIGHPPHAFGAAGDVKLTHAVALHGAQVLPVLAVMIGLAIADHRRALTLMRMGVAGYAALLAFVLVQAFTGHAPFDVAPISITGAIASALLTIAIAALVWPSLEVTRGLLTRVVQFVQFAQRAQTHAQAQARVPVQPQMQAQTRSMAVRS